MRETAGRRDGFTLFEILGAVTILAIVYSWLATSAMQGMRSEGLSKRRLEASLRIDEELMALETDLATGTVPPVGHTEQDLDDSFHLVVDVTPFDPTPYLGEDFPPEGLTQSLLLPPDKPDQALLRVVDMRLQWEEGGNPFEVRRTTLVQDQEQIAQFFPDNGQGGATGQTGADTGKSGSGKPTDEEGQKLLEMLKSMAK